jgi:threonine-phosphate decarboxylase
MQIDLASNHNFLTPNVNIDLSKIKVNEATNFSTLYNVVSKHYKIDQNFLEMYSGINNALYKLIDSSGLNNCYIYAPIDTVYTETLFLKNINVEYINRYIDMRHNVKPNSIIIFQNPSIPDGSCYDLEPMLKMWQEKNCFIIIDESYLEFSPFESVSRYILNYSNLYIIKSFEYFYNIPAIKTAFVISNETNISRLKQYNIQHNISPYDNLYIQEMLKDVTFEKISKATNARSKAYIEKIIKEYSIFNQTVYSYTNTLLIKLNGISGKELEMVLSKFDIIVEDCSKYCFLDSSYVKIVAKRYKDIQTFEKTLEGFISN